jgi:hypothetical protein
MGIGEGKGRGLIASKANMNCFSSIRADLQKGNQLGLQGKVGNSIISGGEIQLLPNAV